MFLFLVCALVACVHFAVQPLPLWVSVGYLGLIFPASLLSLACAIHAFTTRVELTDTGLVSHGFGFVAAEINWDSVTSVRRSPLTPSIVIDTQSGKRIRVSTQLNGLIALARILSRTLPASCDNSIVNWMVEEL